MLDADLGVDAEGPEASSQLVLPPPPAQVRRTLRGGKGQYFIEIACLTPLPLSQALPGTRAAQRECGRIESARVRLAKSMEVRQRSGEKRGPLIGVKGPWAAKCGQKAPELR